MKYKMNNVFLSCAKRSILDVSNNNLLTEENGPSDTIIRWLLGVPSDTIICTKPQFQVLIVNNSFKIQDKHKIARQM